MKLRLQIAASPEKSFVLEYATPLLRIGRDPRAEVALVGEGSQGVSWDHARIELTSRGAVLSDLQSTNGTYVNGQRIDQPVRLRRGDEVQLGQKGPKLLVLEIDTIGAPAANGQPVSAGSRRISRSLEQLLVLLGVMVGFALIAVLTAVWLNQGSGEQKPLPVAVSNPDEPGNRRPMDETKPPEPKPPEKPVEPKPAATKPEEPKPPEKPSEQKPNEQKPAEKPVEPKPVVERRAVGKYAPLGNAPSGLLQRTGDRGAWERTAPQGQVYTTDSLVSLPGYKSELLLDSGVQLLLWGNVLEQLNWPLLESAVTTQEPPAGMDASFTLERGRVIVANRKPSGPAKVRVRFQDQAWDLTLQEAGAEVGLELIGRYTREVGFRSGEGPRAELYLLVLKGQAAVKIEFQQYPNLQAPPGPALFSWNNKTKPAVEGPVRLDQLPPVWNRDPPAHLQAEAMNQALRTLSDRLQENTTPESVLTAMLSSAKPAERTLAVLSLGAIDALPPLLAALGDPKNADVRNAAIFALRQWIGRRVEQDELLYEQLVKEGYTKNEAEIVMQYLHNLSEAQCALPETFAALIQYLKADKLAIRELAYWHLVRLVPDGVKIAYNAAGDAAQRERAYKEWKKLVPDGKLPPRPSGTPTPPRP